MEKKKGLDMEHLTPDDLEKLEIAEEIGVYDRVVAGGWRCLTARESGRIGGILSRRRRSEKKEREKENEG